MTAALNEKSPARAGDRAPEFAQAGGFKHDQSSPEALAAQRQSAEDASRKYAIQCHREPGCIGRQSLALAEHYGRRHRQLSGAAQ